MLGFLLVLALAPWATHAFSLPKSAPYHRIYRPTPRAGLTECLAAGDVIKVIADVNVKGSNANGMTGVISKVFGEGDDSCEDDWGACCELAWGEPTLTVSLHRTVAITGYFELKELKLARRDEASVEDFKARERERWLAVYDEEWPDILQELYEGDLVEVVRDVPVKGLDSALGLVGSVTNVWMECETDAACCCNELATAPITVQFDVLVPDESTELVGYFCEDEVELLSTADCSPDRQPNQPSASQ